MKKLNRSRRSFFLLASATLLTGSSVFAADKYWIGGSGLWDDPSKWLPGGIPVNGDPVFISSAGSDDWVVTFPSSVSGLSLPQLYMATTGSGAVTLHVQGGDLWAGLALYGRSAVIQDGGRVGGAMQFGSDSSYTLNAGTLSGDGDFHHGGGGTFTQNGGTATVSGILYMGGVWNLTNGSLTVNNEIVGGEGPGVLNQSGGTNTADSLRIHTVYNLNGGTARVNNVLNLVGTLDFGGSTATVTAADGSTVDLSKGNVLHSQNAGLTVGNDSLTIVKPGFDPAAVFAHFSTGGLVHTTGTTLVVPAGRTVKLSEFHDPMQVAGTVSINADLLLYGDTEIQAGGSVSGGIFFDVGAPVTVDVGGMISVPNIALGRAGSSGAITQNGGSVSGGMSIASGSSYTLNAGTLAGGDFHHSGGGTFTQNGGTAAVSGVLFMGGEWNLNAGTLDVNWEIVGGEGPGTLNQSGGTHSANILRIQTVYNMTGGTAQINDSMNLLGTLNFGNGAATIHAADGSTVDLSLGDVLNAQNATLSVGNDSLTIVRPGFDPNTVFGHFETGGLLHMTGTTLVVPAGRSVKLSEFQDPMQVDGTVLVNIDLMLFGDTEIRPGGTVTGGIVLDIGSALTVDAGATVSVPSIAIGRVGTPGFVTQNGGSVSGGMSIGSGSSYTLNAGTLSGGGDFHHGGGGTFTQNGGAATVSGILYMGGVWNLTNGSLTVNNEIVGGEGPGVLNQTGGTNTANSLEVNTTYSLHAGTLSATNAIVGHLTNGVLTQTGGVAAIGSTLTIGYLPTDGAVYNLQDGQLDVPNLFVNNRFEQSGGVCNTGSATIGQAGVYHAGGQLNVQNNLTVAGTLRGSGPIAANAVIVSSGGTIAPGNSVSALIINGNLVMANSQDSTVEIEVGGSNAPANAGVTFDVLTVSGTLTLANSHLNVIPLGGIVIGAEYKIIAASSYNPNSGNVFGKLNDLVASNNYISSRGSFQYSLRYEQNDGVYISFSSVPEPGGAVLILFGAGIGFGRRRFQRQSKKRYPDCT